MKTKTYIVNHVSCPDDPHDEHTNILRVFTSAQKAIKFVMNLIDRVEPLYTTQITDSFGRLTGEVSHRYYDVENNHFRSYGYDELIEIDVYDETYVKSVRIVSDLDFPEFKKI